MLIDINTNQWRCEPRPGPCTFSGEGVLHRDSVLWLGLVNAEGKRPAHHLMALSSYDLLLEEWTNCPTSGYPPSRRFGFSAGLIQDLNKFIVFGGKLSSGKCSDELHLLDVESKGWIQPVVKGQSPKKRFRHGSCVDNGMYYCYGGGDNGRYAYGIFMLQLSANNVATWSKPKLILEGQLRPELSSFALVPCQGILLFCGGLGRRKQGLRSYDPKTGKMEVVGTQASGEFEGYGFGISAITLQKDNVVGIFGSENRFEN